LHNWLQRKGYIFDDVDEDDEAVVGNAVQGDGGGGASNRAAGALLRDRLKAWIGATQ
jgi:hypothetical protein